MTTAKPLTHDHSLTVRLPEKLRFEGSDVEVHRIGNDVVLSDRPVPGGDALLQALAAFEPGTQLRREQPALQEAG